MGLNNGETGRYTGLLLLENLDVLSLEENLLVVRSQRRIRMNGKYRLKLPRQHGAGVLHCRVSACELTIEKDGSGKQEPLYKAELEVTEAGDSDACGLRTLRACVA